SWSAFMYLWQFQKLAKNRGAKNPSSKTKGRLKTPIFRYSSLALPSLPYGQASSAPPRLAKNRHFYSAFLFLRMGSK
ncbi:MAG: hypothetical protein FWC93_08565, partial [Defluviitaleaceae bacterium]|nr:hypothetical protein [Defluviitaleaceae bacterium]